MEKSKEVLLSLVRGALWGDEVKINEAPIDWSEVLMYAHQQTVLGLIAEVVPTLPIEMQPDEINMDRLRKNAMRICQSHSLLNRTLAKLKKKLDAHSIHSVLFKGQGVAKNYPNPLSRQCGDIDMYVGESNFLKAMDILEPEQVHNVNDYKHMKHFNIEMDGVHLEIHRIAEILPGFREDRLFREWTEEKLKSPEVRKVIIGGEEINLPPVDFDPLYIMNHAWHHFINGGISIRQLCDWSIYLHRFHKEIDEEVLANNLERFSLYRAWQILSSVAVRYLGLPAEECPLYDSTCDKQADMTIEVILNEGNFGRYSSHRNTPRPKGHFAGKFHSFRMNTSRLGRIIRISPADVLKTWIYYFINGMRNLFVRLK